MKTLLTAYVFLILTCVGFTQDGTLDLSFSGDGIDEFDIGTINSQGLRSVVQTDGKIIVAGRKMDSNPDYIMFVRRYNEDGTIDLSFNGTGTYIFDELNGTSSTPSSLFLQSDGKILLSFYTSYNLNIVRLNSDGTIDYGFGDSGGMKTLSNLYYETNGDNGSDVKVLDDGKIVVVGDSKSPLWNANEERNIFIARLLSDGAFDESFNGDGFDIKTITWINTTGTQLEITSDGGALVHAISTSMNDNKIYMLKYDVDGYLDYNFATNGILTISASPENSRFKLFSDNTFLMYRSNSNWETGSFSFVKYTSTGAIDNTYSSDGIFSFDYDLGLYVPWDEYPYGHKIYMQKDGKMLLSFYVDDSGVITSYLVRYNTNGTQDMTFGDNGVFELPNSYIYRINGQNDSKIILSAQSNNNFAVYRLNGSCSLPPKPTSIEGSSTLCLGSSYTYSVPTSFTNNMTLPNLSFVWTVPTDWSFTASTTRNFNVSPTSTGQINVQSSNECGLSDMTIKDITIITDVPPAPATVYGSVDVCEYSEYTYSVDPIPGVLSSGGFSWAYQNGNLSGWSQSTSIDYYVYGSDVIEVKAYNACGYSEVTTLAINVVPLPSDPVFTASFPTEVCPAVATTFEIEDDQYTSYLEWTYPTGWVNNYSGSNFGVATPSRDEGVISVTAFNQCGLSSNTVSTNISVTPKPVISGITGNDIICANSTANFSTANLQNVYYYDWSYPSGWSGFSQTNEISLTPNSSGGTLSLIANGICEQSDPYSINVSVVSSVPNAPSGISGPTNVCSGIVNTFSIADVANSSYYTWTLPNSWTGSSTNTSIDATAGNFSGSIYVRAVNGCGNSAATELPITVNTAIPSTPTSITGNNIVCTNSTNNYVVGTVNNASSYTWTKPSGWTGTSNTETISLTATTTSGNITVKANNACGSSTAFTYAVSSVNPMPAPTSITGNTTVCNTSSNTYTASSVNGASTYTWTLPSGWTGTSSSTSINLIAGVADGNISVAANNECGAGTPKTLAVSSIDIPVSPNNIAGDQSICRDSTTTFSVDPVADASAYTWTLPSAWTGSSTISSIAAIAGNSGSITVTADNMCGSSAPISITITVVDNPAHPTITKSGNLLICDITAFDYQWYVNGFAIPGATNQTYQIDGDGNYSVVAFNSLGCFAASYFGYQVALEENNMNTFKLSPNPNNGTFDIAFYSPLSNTTTIEIIDATGKLIYSTVKNQGNTIKLNIALMDGVYFCKIHDDQHHSVIKFIKE